MGTEGAPVAAERPGREDIEERRAGVPEGPWRGGRGGHPVRPRTRAACMQLVLRQARAVCRGTAAPEGQGAGSRSPSLPPWALPPRGAEGWARLPWHPHQAPVPGADPGRRILASGEGQARVRIRFLRAELPLPAGGWRPKRRWQGWCFSSGCQRRKEVCNRNVREPGVSESPGLSLCQSSCKPEFWNRGGSGTGHRYLKCIEVLGSFSESLIR